MGAKLEVVSRDELLTAAESLSKVADAMNQAAIDMQAFGGMTELRLPWSQRQWDAIELIITLGANVATLSPSQFVAHKLKRPSIQEKVMSRSAKDRAKRAEVEGPKRGPGRPRKKAT